MALEGAQALAFVAKAIYKTCENASAGRKALKRVGSRMETLSPVVNTIMAECEAQEQLLLNWDLVPVALIALEATAIVPSLHSLV